MESKRQLAFCVAATMVALAGTLATGPAGAAAAPADPPNVVVVMTDDQTASAIGVMPRTQSLIGAQGATFEESFATFPLCCPSRATFLTGPVRAQPPGAQQHPPAGWLRRPARRRDPARLAAARRLLHGADRQVPERLRDERRRRPARLQRVARAEDAERLLRLRPARGRAAGPLRRRERGPRRPRRPGDLLERRLHGQGRRLHRPAGAAQPAVLPLGRLQRAALGDPRSASGRGRPLPRQRQARGTPRRRLRGRPPAVSAELQRGRHLRQADLDPRLAAADPVPDRGRP